MKPTIKSAVAKFITNQLKGVRKFLLGSRTTARIMKMLPGILVRISIKDILADINDNLVGASMLKHLLSNVLSTTMM